MLPWLSALLLTVLAHAAPVEVALSASDGAVVGVEALKLRTAGDLRSLAESTWYGKKGTTPLRVGHEVQPDLAAWTARATASVEAAVGARADLTLRLDVARLVFFRSSTAVYAEAEVRWSLVDALGARRGQGLATAEVARDQSQVAALDEVFDLAMARVVESQVLRTAYGEVPAVAAPEPELVVAACGATAVHGLREAVRAVVVLRTDRAIGTGVVISPDGLVVTAGHVVREAKEITARFGDGVELPARLVRGDRDRDVALLRLEGADLPCLVPREAPAELGEDLYAIGTPGGEALAFSLSKGIVSGVREAGTLSVVQTDAALNPGNSGGPLVDTEGRWLAVVGFKIVGLGLEGLAFGLSARDTLGVLGVDGLQSAAP